MLIEALTRYLIPLLMLSVLEIVLGIDNIVFISIQAARLPPKEELLARRLGLIGALGMRISLLALLFWLTRLTAPLFTILNHAVSARDLILLAGGLFLIRKATQEIDREIEGNAPSQLSFGNSELLLVVGQIMAMDLIFSLDSIITAVGMVDILWVMATAIVLAVTVMLLAIDKISDLIHSRPSLKMLALAFLLLIGFTLLLESVHIRVPKDAIYFAMGFSVFVEFLNMHRRTRVEEFS